MQAIILAAGMGKRLKELTQDATKCMVKVNGVSLIDRALHQLDKFSLKQIILVIGYEGKKLQDYVSTLDIKTPIVYVNNEIYNKTNNIYSLYLAKDYLLEDDTLLLESDIIFADSVLQKLLDNPYPSLALVDKFESWMDGTVVTLDENNGIREFLGKKDFKFEDIPQYYKTVNIYKFSKNFSTTHYVPFLEAYSKALGRNEYYEQVLKVITLLEKPEIKALPLSGDKWYEIDDKQDLDIAESMFTDKKEKYRKIAARFGGYWRYPHLKDYCYLVNPYYPDSKLIDEIKANFEALLTAYPSGMRVNSLLGAKYFGLLDEQVVVGNGAAELIKSLLTTINGKIGCIYPTFEEYPHRADSTNLVPYMAAKENNFAYTAQDLMDYFSAKDLKALVLINPDNPSGNFIPKNDLLNLTAWAKREDIQLIIDESFVDFADDPEASLLDHDFLNKNDHLVVIKSISKSFGVPGLRLGIMASGNKDLIAYIKKDVAIWNINSFAEFYLQIFEKYQKNYQQALHLFRQERALFLKELKEIPDLEILPSQANYFMCKLPAGISSEDLAADLLDQHEILIKDLSGKNGIKDNFIRIAIKTREENHLLAAALKLALS